ncbi:MAG TPA: hypothetical protein DIC60_04120 [Lachnospiraceae bacterium]|nr:hypothetical protein [Lachnospiraceae bacterium]
MKNPMQEAYGNTITIWYKKEDSLLTNEGISKSDMKKELIDLLHYGNYEELWNWLNAPYNPEERYFTAVLTANEYFNKKFDKEKLVHFIETDCQLKKETTRSMKRN